MLNGGFNLVDFVGSSSLFKNFGVSSSGFFSFPNVTVIDGGRKRNMNISGNTVNLKLNHNRCSILESELPSGAMMCSKSSEFLSYIGNLVDFLCKVSMVDNKFKFNTFSEFLRFDIFNKIIKSSLNSVFNERNCSLFVGIDDCGRFSYSMQFIDLSFRFMSIHNDLGEHIFVFDVLGDSERKYIIKDINDLHIIKNYIVKKSKLYGLMESYGYNASDDADNSDLLNVVKIVTMANN